MDPYPSLSLAITLSLTDGSIGSPVVTLDLSKYDTESGQRELALELLEAVNQKGFFYLKNFGLSAEQVNRQFGIGSEFYSVPLENRLKSLSDLEHGNSNGYAPAGKRQVGQGLTGRYSTFSPRLSYGRDGRDVRGSRYEMMLIEGK